MHAVEMCIYKQFREAGKGFSCLAENFFEENFKKRLTNDFVCGIILKLSDEDVEKER